MTKKIIVVNRERAVLELIEKWFTKYTDVNEVAFCITSTEALHCLERGEDQLLITSALVSGDKESTKHFTKAVKLMNPNCKCVSYSILELEGDFDAHIPKMDHACFLGEVESFLHGKNQK